MLKSPAQIHHSADARLWHGVSAGSRSAAPGLWAAALSAGALFDGEAKSVRTVNLIEKGGGHHPTYRQRVPQPQRAESRQLTNDALCQLPTCKARHAPAVQFSRRVALPITLTKFIVNITSVECYVLNLGRAWRAAFFPTQLLAQ